MKRIAYLLPLLLPLITTSVFGQVPVIQWQRLLGSSNGDYAGSIKPTTDGGYIAAGYTEGKDGDVVGYHGNVGIEDIWIVKLDGAGTVQWTRCLGGTFMETGADIKQTADGGYIVAGSSSSIDCGMAPNHGGLDFWLVKLSSTGDIQWQKMYGGSLNEYGVSLSMAPDGGYFIGGYTNSGNQDVTGYHDNGDPYNNFDWWIIKVDASGNLQWEKTLGGTGNDQCNSVQATPDGGCIAAGFTVSSNGDVTGFHGGNGDAWVVKLSNTGTVQWQKTYGGTQADAAQSIQLTSDGNYIFAGFAGSNDGDVSGNHQSLGAFTDFWVVKIAPTGAVLWQKCYGGKFNEQAFTIRAMTDGGYVIGGTAESPDGDLTCNAGLTDVWIIKIDATGNLVWSKSMGGSYYDETFAVEALSDGSFIMAATSCSMEFPGYHPNKGGTGTCGDYWIVKLSAPLPIAPPPLVTLSPSSGKVCTGLPATFTANAVNTGVAPAYAWTLNGVPVGTNSPIYTAANFNNGDVLAVGVTAATGTCANDSRQNTAAVTITASATNLHPAINITSSTNVYCDCTPVLFQAAVTGGGAAPSYMWMLNGAPTGNTAASWLASGILPTDLISCQYSDASGCIAGGMVISNDIALQATAGGGSTAIITGQSNSCPGDLLTFTASPINGGINPSYQWQVNGANVGTNSPTFSSQTLIDGDKVNCIVTPDPSLTCVTALPNPKPFIVSIKPTVPLTIDIKGPPGAYCKGQPITFGATATNVSGNETWQWTVNAAPVGANSPSLIQPFNDGDIVQCTVTQPSPSQFCLISNTATSTPITVQVLNQPAPTVSIIATGNNVCAGSDIAFTATVGNAGSGSSVQWMVNGTPAGNPGSAFSGSLKNNDLVTCQLTPGTGTCSQAPLLSNSITAVVFPLPSVTISPADTVVLYGSQVTLTASVSGDVTSYQWAPAGLLTNGLSLSTPTVPLTTDVSITLAVSTAEQCESTAVAVIKIGHPLIMPSAFSPNGDGVNDIFRIPPGTTLQLQEFQVYDRWGNKVFATRNINIGWDGTISGSPAPTGTYVYFVIGSDNKGPVKNKGTVVLVR